MKDLTQERIRLLAEENGWSVAHAEGFMDGETCRRRSTMPSKYVQVGIDEYCLGFRAGYYERSDGLSTPLGKNVIPIKLRQRAGA